MKASAVSLLKKVLRRLRRYRGSLTRLRRMLIRRPALFTEGYTPEDNTQVTLYTDRADLFPGYHPRVQPAVARRIQPAAVTLIAVAKNEAATTRAWFAQIARQTRPPQEIIVVDTGSSDGTPALLRELAQSSPTPLRVIEAPGVNISQGRNLAIQAAQFDVIAVTDFGTRARPDWLERLVLPFEVQPDTEVSGGWYEAISATGKPYRWRKWISLLGKNPQEILSPSVSIAFTRAAWQRVGGYPEWLTMTGEDTYLDLELKRTCQRWAFSPEALVDWEAPGSIWQYWKKMARWAEGDGETGMRAGAYWYAALVSALTLAGLGGGLLLILAGALLRNPLVLAAGVLVVLVVILRAARSGVRAGYSAQEVILVVGILAAQAVGFIRGARRRRMVARRRFQTVRGITFILAGIPIDDTGGGARSTQIALELLRRGQLVCYVNMYPKSESVELNLVIRHPNLVTIAAADFSLERFCATYAIDLARYSIGAIVELPHPQWLPVIEALQKQGGKVVYELIDEWDSNLGAGWYSPEVEGRTAQSADARTATAPRLQERLQAQVGLPVCLLPNAVNLRLFNRHKTYPRPVDLPAAQPVITYIGALYGSWFDWDLLVQTARAYPSASIVVIGDYRGQCPVVLPNLHFLGLKPQTSLPGYLAHTNVAIIPWKVNEITQATSPLKLYEYLAMHVPVVVPDLLPLREIPAVFRAVDRDGFVRNIHEVLDASFPHAAVDAFVAQNSWQARVDQLMQMMDFRD